MNAPAKALPKPGSLGAWMLAIRPKTLTASIAPVIVGVGYAFWGPEHRLYDSGYPVLSSLPRGRVIAAFLVGLGIQIGTNLVNDVADHFKGADTPERLGPPRVTNVGLLEPRTVVVGAVVAFSVAAAAGAWLAAVTSWTILIPGALALACGVLYTVGPVSIAYLGLGEIFVLAFFGIFATAGTTFVILERWVSGSIIAGVAMGLLAVGILQANNIRDIATDAPVGKRTLAVRIGDGRARVLYAAVIVSSLLAAVAAGPWPASSFVLLCAPLAWLTVAPVLRGASGRDLIGVLQRNSLLELVVGLVIATTVVVWAPVASGGPIK